MNNPPDDAARLPVLLVVDDSALIRSTVKRALAGLRVEIVYAEDGFTGLKLATSRRPDMILADVMMPRMSGLQFAALIKNNFATMGTAFYLLTSKDGEVDKAQGRNSGVDGYIVKPFQAPELRSLVANSLGATEPETEPAPG